MPTNREANNWLQWFHRSAEKKRIEAQQKAIRPFIRPVQRQGELLLTTKKQ